MRTPRALPLLAVMAAIACESTTGPSTELATARLRWAARGPTSYTVTVSHGCFCPVEAVGPVIVTVTNGVVQSRRYVNGGADVPANFASLFPTVDGLFARIDSAHAANVAHLTVEYDPLLGYPTRVDIDHDERIADDEVYYRASVQRP